VLKEFLGTCVSMGVKVDGKNPKEVIEGVDEGVYDDVIGEE
ncbi:MAG: 50S ribosomal protein L11, partial [Candidatus Bathyarchaeia archaeon]